MRHKLTLLLSTYAFGFAVVVLHGATTWMRQADLLAGRWLLAVAAATDGTLYAIGGGNVPGASTSAVEAYDTRAAAWRRVSPLPTRRIGLAAAADRDGRIFAFGGADHLTDGRVAGLSTVEAYDPAANTWTRRARMPTARFNLAATRGNDGRIYVVGGENASKSLDTLEIYDPRSDSWTTGAPMPTPRLALAVVAGNDGRVYALGGTTRESPFFLDTVEAYDPRADRWTVLSPLPTPRYNLVAVTSRDGRIFAIGGYNGDYLPTVEIYDPDANAWTVGPDLGVGREAAAATTALNRIYVVGGRRFNETVANVESLVVSAAATQRFRATADAYVRGGIFSSTRFGTAPVLRVKKGVSENNTRRTYLKFDLGRLVDVQSAILRLHGRTSVPGQGTITTTLYAVDDVDWSEQVLTWNSRPALREVVGSLRINRSSSFYDVDVTEFVRAKLRAERRVISVALRNVTHSTNYIEFDSRERGETGPILVVTPAR
jgi:hypothetical protein